MSSDTQDRCVWPIKGDAAQETVYSCGGDRLGMNPSLVLARAVTEGTSSASVYLSGNGHADIASICAVLITRETLPLALCMDELIHSSQSLMRQVLLHFADEETEASGGSETGGAA